ncbi:hypothetical protein GCM10023214_48520 [Amycolatopsis dongchuanensis]|uniref:RNA 2-O ribose methyltransferase substrate binding domain-containing protein n=1 Tax=Amycolatopsis dongchuanensis TaxID=1070866 RepID=A0ABP9R0V1_9PSEU
MDPFTERTPRVVAARRLLRRAEREKTGRFLAEGANAVAAALAHGGGFMHELFVTARAEQAYPELVTAAREAGVRVSPVTDRAADGLSETVTPQGIVAVCDLLTRPLDGLLSAALAEASDAASGLSPVAAPAEPGAASAVPPPAAPAEPGAAEAGTVSTEPGARATAAASADAGVGLVAGPGPAGPSVPPPAAPAEPGAGSGAAVPAEPTAGSTAAASPVTDSAAPGTAPAGPGVAGQSATPAAEPEATPVDAVALATPDPAGARLILTEPAAEPAPTQPVTEPAPRLPAAARLVAVLVDVADPGNAGTVIRVADAAGADAVILAGDSVDPHNGKCVRASAGSLFHLPLARERDVTAVLAACRAAGLRLLGAHGYAETELDDLPLDAPVAWVFGNEAHGLPAEVLDAVDEAVRIPIYGRAESLNLATAAAVCLYGSAMAQRRSSGG